MHRYHYPLVYGRIANDSLDKGIGIIKGVNKEGLETYMLSNFNLPYLTARCLPLMVEFFNKFIGKVDDFDVN